VHTFLEELSNDDYAVFDQVEWKRYWFQNQRYQTLCVPCLSLEKADQTQRDMSLESQKRTTQWGPIFLEGKSKAIIKKWYLEAQGKTHDGISAYHIMNEFSSDDDEDDLSLRHLRDSNLQLEPKATNIASSWLTIARFNLSRKNSSSVVT